MLNFYAATGAKPNQGYGKVEIRLLQELHALGIPLSLGGPISREGYDLLPLKATDGPPLYDTTIVTGIPEAIFKTDGWWNTRLVALVMSETEAPSSQWVKLFNQFYAMVLVTCPGLVEYYKAAGVTVPVVNINMGVDYSPTPFTNKRLKEWRKPEHQFVALSYSYGDMRKGAHLAIMAFKAVLGDNPHAQLWIKARYDGPNWLDGCQDDQIKVIQDDLTDVEMTDLIRQADVYVFPSYGEGFGLPPREATLAGTPALATQWLGMWDVNEWGVAIQPGRYLPANFDQYTANAKGAKWREPDYEDLVAKLKWMVAMPKEDRQKIALKGRRYLRKNFTWAKVAHNIMEAIGAHDRTNSTAA